MNDLPRLSDIQIAEKIIAILSTQEQGDINTAVILSRKVSNVGDRINERRVRQVIQDICIGEMGILVSAHKEGGFFIAETLEESRAELGRIEKLTRALFLHQSRYKAAMEKRFVKQLELI